MGRRREVGVGVEGQGRGRGRGGGMERPQRPGVGWRFQFRSFVAGGLPLPSCDSPAKVCMGGVNHGRGHNGDFVSTSNARRKHYLALAGSQHGWGGGRILCLRNPYPYPYPYPSHGPWPMPFDPRGHSRGIAARRTSLGCCCFLTDPLGSRGLGDRIFSQTPLGGPLGPAVRAAGQARQATQEPMRPSCDPAITTTLQRMHQTLPQHSPSSCGLGAPFLTPAKKK